jgi:hypothetical protein
MFPCHSGCDRNEICILMVDRRRPQVLVLEDSRLVASVCSMIEFTIAIYCTPACR